MTRAIAILATLTALTLAAWRAYEWWLERSRPLLITHTPGWSPPIWTGGGTVVTDDDGYTD
jgi:Ser/Thr protein kinase RdoA (MazF antagonist)